MDLMDDLPSGYVKIAIENGRNSEFSHQKRMIFHGYVRVPAGT